MTTVSTSSLSHPYKRLDYIISALVGFVILLLIFVAIFKVWQPITVLPRFQPAPGFRFASADGTILSSADQIGKLTLYSISYADCTVDCPQSAENIAAIRSALTGQITGDIPLEFVTFSLSDNEGAAERASTFGQLSTAESDIAWHWLNGSADLTRAVIGGGFSHFYKGDADGGVEFDPLYVLVDDIGMIRGRYFSAEPDPTILIRDIGYVVSERENLTGVDKVGYDAAHLFLCFPR